MLGKKEKPTINRQIVGFTKARKILFFTIKPRPIYREVVAGTQPAATMTKTGAQETVNINESEMKGKQTYAAKVAQKHKDLGPSLNELGLKITPEEHVKRCITKAAAIAIAVTIASAVAIIMFSPKIVLVVLAPLLGVVSYQMTFNAFVIAPISKTKVMGKDVEKDILYAARDMIVSMRSGLPLFNAMATVSVGYGAASREFEKIIDRVQLGMPMEQAIDEVSAKSQSPTFKRLMLQTSTSIKVGSDVINSIQEVISDVSQERVIELRRYGQRLNAIAMFYMLFGVIFPSMGLAVASIMSTFISFIPISNNTLILAAFGLACLQFIFLKMVSSSRPSFAT